MTMHKCENCGKEVRWIGRKQRGQYCAGWVGSCKSRWGKQYDRGRGMAWWCPASDCQEQKRLNTLEAVFPSMSISTMQFLMREAELERLREN